MPFLAPALPFILGGASAAGAVAKGRAAGRQAETEQNAQQDALRLKMAEFNRNAPNLRARDSVRGDLLSQLQPYTLSGSGRDVRGSGGLSPALLSGDTRQLGSSMTRNALISQLGGPQAPSAGQQQIEQYLQSQPQGGFSGRLKQQMQQQLQTQPAPYQDPYTVAGPTPPPQASLLDKLLGGAGLAGGAVTSIFGGR